MILQVFMEEIKANEFIQMALNILGPPLFAIFFPRKKMKLPSDASIA